MRMSVIISALVALLVGFGGSVAIILSAADALGTTNAQNATWITVLCLSMMGTNAILSVEDAGDGEPDGAGHIAYPISSLMFWAVDEELKPELKIYNFIEHWKPGMQNPTASANGRDVPEHRISEITASVDTPADALGAPRPPCEIETPTKITHPA